MFVKCAWCKKPIGVKEPLDNHDTTHGICAQCKVKLGKKYKIGFQPELLGAGDFKDIIAKKDEP